MMGIRQGIAVSAIVFLSSFLSACGDSGGFWENKASSFALEEADDDSANEPLTYAKQLGRMNNDAFVAGELHVTTDQVAAYGNTQISAVIYDMAGNVYTEPTEISFSSACSQKNLATLATPQDSKNGKASTIYTANGCIGEDKITASAFIEGKDVTASATVNVEAATIHALRFVSATPSRLNIKGFGEQEESIVQFMIVDKEGRAVANQSVDFSVSTEAGGITLSDTSTTSDENGIASIAIHAGTTATSVRVTATLTDNKQITATSDVLVISTGVADQNSMTLSLSVHNPEAWNIMGNEVSVNVHAADHFNNPVADGTQVYFTAEGGQIDPECEIQNGSCKVIWRSSAPFTCYGRIKILAVMTGEESFIDANGNGILDNDETFYDMPEAFRDDNENGQFDEGKEEFWDFNQNNQYDIADGQYNGTLCNPETNPKCSANKQKIYVRDSINLIMASSTARIELLQADSNGSYAPLENDTLVINENGAVASVVVSSNLTGRDIKQSCDPTHEDASMFQPMPADTEIELDLKEGELLSESKYKVGNTSVSSPSYFPIIIAPPKLDSGTTLPESSILSVKVKTQGYGDMESSLTQKYFNVRFDLPEPIVEEPTDATDDQQPEEPEQPTYQQIPTNLHFVSSEPKSIGIRGFGMVESSKLVFKLVDQRGNPMAKQGVNFSLNTSVGGIRLSENSAESDEEGLVYIHVYAGVVATNVRVTATLANDASIHTQSDNLVISTGVTDQNSFTVYADILNPEGLSWNGEEVEVFVIASDHFNNPVPDGSSVYFMTEGGQIDPECMTKNGQCSVKWRSAQPRPADARVSILATMLGEESFFDSNGNGIQDGDDGFDDIGEAYLDVNENGRYDEGREEFRDFNENGIRDPADGKYNGILCASDSCSDRKNIFVRKNLVLVLSGSEGFVQTYDARSGLALNNKITLDESGKADVQFKFMDQNGHPLPAETTIELAADQVAISPSSFVIGSTNNVQAGVHQVHFDYDRSKDTIENPFAGERLTVTFKTPNDIETTRILNILPIIVNESEPVEPAPETEAPQLTPSALSFVSALPTNISIRGFATEGSTSSAVAFKVIDTHGNPVPNQDINFSLNTSVGGIQLSTDSAPTNDNGEVTVLVHAGTISTNVRVTATLATNPSISIQSDNLVISTGIADQNSFNIYSELIDSDALKQNADGKEVRIHAIASDHFNNPVPDGSTVYFMAEGGQVGSECRIIDGTCSVIWRNTLPRPADGRISILATMLGEESFFDGNGNGIQDGDDPFDDMAEAYLDANENEQYDEGQEEFRDFNENGIRDEADGKYNGILCAPESCSDRKNIFVRRSLILTLEE